MKKKNCVVIALFCCSFICLDAQGTSHQPILKVGERAPAISVYKWVKGTLVSNFEKGHTYLVEFGATWCHPCGEAIPHLTEIAKKYKDKLTVIGVFVMEYMKDSLDRSYVPRVEKYVNNQGPRMEYNVAIDDFGRSMELNWLKAAGLEAIPESFIVDKDGMIAWIGNSTPEILERVIDLVTNPSYSLQDAIDASNFQTLTQVAKIDNTKPWSMPGDEENKNNFICRSILNKYHGETTNFNSDYVFTRSWAKWATGKQLYNGMIQQIGVSLAKLYYLAYADTIGYETPTRFVDGTPNYPDTVKYPTLRSSYGRFWYRPILEVGDSQQFSINDHSLENKYNYSLLVGDNIASAALLQRAMQADLKVYFGYDVIVKDSLMPCWNLIATDSATRLLRPKSSGQPFRNFEISDTLFGNANAMMKDIWIRLCLAYSFGHSSFDYGHPPTEAPFVDETGITGDIDYSISRREFTDISNRDWGATLRFLHRWGLDLVNGTKLIKVVIITNPS
jgi:thiol-disulfide isomerase/thioredoxin